MAPPKPRREPAAESSDESDFGVDVDGDGEADGVYINDEWTDFDTTTIPPGDHGPFSESTRPGAADRDCSDYSGPVRVGGSDPHGLDRDNDGIGCE